MDLYLLAVLTVPIVLLLSNREWLFPTGNTSDSWEYFTFWFEWGRVHDPALYGIGSFAGAAKAARLSWILKGVLAHRLLPPLAAHYALHLAMLFAAIVLFYLIAKRLFNAQIAFLSTVAFATCSQFHNIKAWEWDYNGHDTVVNVLLALLLSLAAARGTRPRLALFAAGIAAASITQDPYAAPCLPVLAFWYLSLRRDPRALRLWPSLGYFAAGGAVITLVYGLISYSAGGALFYYQPMLTYLLVSSPHVLQYQYPSWAALGEAVKSADGLQIPAAMTAASLGMLVHVWRRQHTQEHTPRIVTCGVGLLLGMLGAIALLLGEHDLTGFAQEARLVTLALAPMVFLAGAALLAIVLGRRSYGRMDEILLAGVAYAVFVAPLVLWQDPGTGSDGVVATWNRILGALTLNRDQVSRFIWLAIAAPFLVIAVPLASMLVSLPGARRFTGVVLVAIFFSNANVASASIPPGEYALKYRSCGYLQDQFQAVVDSYRAIRAVDSDYGLFLWYKKDARTPYPVGTCPAYGTTLFDLYRSLWSARYYSMYGPPPIRQRRAEIEGSARNRQHLRSIVAEEFGDEDAPSDPMGVLGHPDERSDFQTLPHPRYWLFVTPNPLHLAVLSSDPDDARRAAATLERLGANVQPLGTIHVQHGAISFDIAFLRVSH